MTTLQIKHLPGSAPASFQIARLPDGKSTEAAVVPSPVGFPIADRPDSDLMAELRWYLEEFLDYPFPPQTEQAEHVRDALKAWGSQAFQALFSTRAAGRLVDEATRDLAAFHLQVWSDDPQVLAWPWEALRDSESGVLAHTCQVERRLSKDVRDPPPLPPGLPRDQVHILLVTPRPYPSDAPYRSISRPLVELIEQQRLPAHVDVLRPPTFDQLREHLRSHPGHYHILHFDGHGLYAGAAAEGALVFEKDDGEPDPVGAEQLSALLREHAVPAVVLNACRSATLDPQARAPFASVAAALLQSGMRGVVAMAYSLYVSGAQGFLPAFYRRLFEEGSVAQAVRAGRQQLLAHKGRTSPLGQTPLDDWLVPVLYQQDPFDFSFAGAAKATFVPRRSRLPAQITQVRDPYGFLGRDGALLQLERALRRPPAGILIHGPSGVGKTALARGLCQWLDATAGLGEGCLWFSCPEFVTAIQEGKLDAATLRERRALLVWDGFDGVPATDQPLLARFLERLRGGATKVLITSRSTEDWLGPTRRYVLTLAGLAGEERWELGSAILRDLGKAVDRQEPALKELMDLLGGHPRAMRVLLPRLEQRTAAELVKDLQSNPSLLEAARSEPEVLATEPAPPISDTLGVTPMAKNLIYIGYARGQDDALALELEDQLAPLEPPPRSLRRWSERNIPAGATTRREIDDHLAQARIIVLLVTARFLADAECQKLLDRALQLRQPGQVDVVPVLADYCLWDLGPLGQLSPVPDRDRPVKAFANRNEAWSQVVRGLLRVL